jgi:light-regulated signal transduction histidine kinase (bacteriophytochrome)
VSHDLRAPLRSIAGFSEILLEDYAAALDREGKDFLQRIIAAARHANALIDDLLTLARAPRQEIRPAPVDLGDVARRIVARLREQEPGRTVEFVCPQTIDVRADPRLLGVLLENLLGNAWKYTRKRSAATIEIGCVEQQGQRAYFVRDNGAGFDMAFADRLFEPFRRLHSADEFEGTGIGLATVQRIVLRHGGRIWAEAQLDQGAVFYFTLGEQAPPAAAPA